MQPSRIRFTPVQLKARHDGWTPARQFRFIEELAATKSIAKACRAVQMSRMSAYKLREHPDARQFRLAWKTALEPDFVARARRSPRAAQRLQRLKQARKVDEVNETDDPPVSLTTVKSTSSALSTLQTYLAVLRSQEDFLGSTRGG